MSRAARWACLCVPPCAAVNHARKIHVHLTTTLGSLVFVRWRLACSRHVARGDRVKDDLGDSYFWLARPELLLVPIKYCLFVCSAAVGSIIFFVWQFGPHSCFRSNSFYFYFPLPWWCVLVISFAILAALSFVTLPMYSLAVRMGSKVDASLAPRRIQRRLVLMAARARRRVAQRKAEEAAAAGEEEGVTLTLAGRAKTAVLSALPLARSPPLPS